MAELLNHGYKVWEYDSAGTKHLVINTDDKGDPMPINLDANGFALEEGAEKEWLPFNRFAKADFANLNLGPFR